MLKSLIGQWVATVYMALISMMTTFVIGRTLGARAFANFSYVLSIASVYLVIMDGGFKTMIFREETRPSYNAVFDRRNLTSLALGHTIMTLLLGCVIVLVLPLYFPRALVLSFVFMGAFAVSGLISSRLKGRGRFLLDACWLIGARTLTTLGMVAGLYIKRESILSIFAGGVVGGLAALLFAACCGLLARPSFLGLKPALYQQVFLFLMIDAATQVYLRSDIILLRYLCPDAVAVGNYAAAARIIAGVALLLAPIGQIFFRRLRLSEDGVAFSQALWPAVLRIGGSGALVALFLYLVSGRLMILCFGSEFQQAGAMLAGLSLALFFMFPCTILTQGTIACNLEKWYAAAAGGGAILNIGLNIILIPWLEVSGAILATIITELFLFAFLSAVLFGNDRRGRQEVTDSL